MALLNWVTGLIRKPAKERAEDFPSYAVLMDSRRRHLSPLERAPTIYDVNFATRSNLIIVGDVHFEYFEKTKDFKALVLHYSPEVMLTPGYLNACALYQAIKRGVIERHSEMVWGDFERRAREVGATWSYLRVLYYEGKRKLWICQGDLTLHADFTRLAKLYSDLQAAVCEAGLSPDDYFALPH